MSKEIYQLFTQIDREKFMKILAPCMDDYLYVLDLQNDTLEISESAVSRFGITDKHLTNAMFNLQSVVYEEDREMLSRHLDKIMEGKEKIHNLHYRWLDKEGMPVWVNCRGTVINDEEGRPGYLLGCLNETGKNQRADNVSGLLKEKEMRSYLYENESLISTGFLIRVDIDDFGMLSSTWGNKYGDYVIKSVADCIKECLSGSQQLYHLIVDQYMIVDLESKTKEEVLQLRNRICEKIKEFIVAEQYKEIFSITVGIIDAKTVSEGYEECRKKSDFALKQAKSMGDNVIYFFEQQDYDRFLRKVKLIHALRSAVVNYFEGFEVYYQPIIEGTSGNVIGAEALMRFSIPSHEGNEWISPVEFIPLLEETGLIIPAGIFVINESVRMCRQMQQYIPKFKISINISHVQITKGTVIKEILSALERNQLKPESICVEMTESGFMDMTPSFCEFRNIIEKNGIQFVIDDFGTGYSNFHCISDMNPDYVKIDKDFTAKAMSNELDYELLKKIIEMIHNLGISICIEGVEQQEWSLKLKEMQVDYLQGYLFARPCEKRSFIDQFASSGQ